MDDELDLKALRRREVQMMGAAISLRSWHKMEDAYNQLRDKIDRELGRRHRSAALDDLAQIDRDLIAPPSAEDTAAAMIKVAKEECELRFKLQAENDRLQAELGAAQEKVMGLADALKGMVVAYGNELRTCPYTRKARAELAKLNGGKQ